MDVFCLFVLYFKGSKWFKDLCTCLQYSDLASNDLKRTLRLTSFHRLLCFLQNLVMFLSLVVAWVIPDVPKTIVEQLKQEKKLLVEVFLKEEKEKFQLIQSLFSKDASLHSGSHNPDQGSFIPGRYSTLPPDPRQGSDRFGEGPRVRCRAASFSQFSRNMSPSHKNENENSRHTVV